MQINYSATRREITSIDSGEKKKTAMVLLLFFSLTISL